MVDFESDLRSVLQSYDKDIVLRSKQIEILRLLWEGDRDIVASLPTGYGKSIIFHLCGRLIGVKQWKPACECVTVVIAPLNIIQRDQLQTLKHHGISACCLDVKGHFFTEERDLVSSAGCTMQNVMNGKYEVIIAHPEALLCTDEGRRLLNNAEFCRRVVALVIDECHTVDLWGDSFRVAFGLLDSLQTFLGCLTIALSATLTKELWVNVPRLLGLRNHVCVSENPDKPNIFLSRKKKPSGVDVYECAQSVYLPEMIRVKELGDKYPVTLAYIQMRWMGPCCRLAARLFGHLELHDLRVANYFSSQYEAMNKHIAQELKRESPHLRLVFCSPAIGMGFDSPCITRVIHGEPPRRTIDFLQQIGRAGRKGQKSEANVYYSSSDISRVDSTMRSFCETDKCMRLCLLEIFGFNATVVPLEGHCCCLNCVSGNNDETEV